MKKKNYIQPNPDDIRRQDAALTNNILSGFNANVNATMYFLGTDEAREYFNTRAGRMYQFFKTSGINNEWDRIIDEHARTGADISTEIYKYALNLNQQKVIREYTETERITMNRIADYTYDLIQDVSREQVRGIKRQLLQDYTNGENPRRTSLLDIQIEPIHTFSPEQRAVMIARTERGRALNCGLLDAYKRDGIRFVELWVTSECEECKAAATELGSVTIEDAKEDPLIHPNCQCTWRPAEGEVVQ